MDKAPIRSPVHSDSPDTSALYRQLVQLRIDTTHQSVMAHADTHLPVHHEGDAAEHLPFHHSRNERQCSSHSVGQVLAWGHGVSICCRSSPPPNGLRLSCGALKNDSFHNLRAPPA